MTGRVLGISSDTLRCPATSLYAVFSAHETSTTSLQKGNLSPCCFRPALPEIWQYVWPGHGNGWPAQVTESHIKLACADSLCLNVAARDHCCCRISRLLAGGQINWMRYITTMKKRSRFSSAVSITAAFMTLVYLLVAVTGYSAFGAGIDLHK